MELCYSHRAEDLDHKYLDSGTGTSSRIMLTCVLPLSEIVTNFFDQLKSRSSGFASFEWVVSASGKRSFNFITLSYEDAGYRRSDLSKVCTLLLHPAAFIESLIIRCPSS
jgi:translation elongation factor EF-4